MSRLTRDGTAEPVSRDQILRHARGQGNIIFPVQLTTSRIGNLTRLIHTLLYVMTIHTLLLFVVTYIQSIVLVANPKIQNTARSTSSQTAAVTFAVELSLQRVKDEGIFSFYEPVIRAGCSI